ncbi:MAG: methyltransferase domain-containing protein [Candidatus Diapherotrites archaeon]|uniref:Methyltransferase domain-containing protein n=1 Tax=Candidatus Iainarchaeum sp. TaxID=3101447 RepID=A0A8T4KTB2_9ARCH|nr:methyltransferase domain-containing protein [Candidatus Diapherotrites archaeon]
MRRGKSAGLIKTQIKSRRHYWGSRAKSWHLVRTPEEIRTFRKELSQSLRGVRGSIVELMSGPVSYHHNAFALDFSTEMLRRNPQFSKGKSIQFDLHSIHNRRLPFRDSSVGAFVIVNATQYLKKPSFVFSELRRYLSKGSKIVIIGSDARGATGKELNNLMSDDLVSILQRLGFEANCRSFNVFYSPKIRPLEHKAPYYKIEAKI